MSLVGSQLLYHVVNVALGHIDIEAFVSAFKAAEGGDFETDRAVFSLRHIDSGVVKLEKGLCLLGYCKCRVVGVAGGVFSAIRGAGVPTVLRAEAGVAALVFAA